MRYREIIEAIESDNDLFGADRLSTALADKFEFPEGGDLGYVLGGGGVSYGEGHRTEGLVIVSRRKKQIAFIPDFTYFDDEPSQEDLEYLFDDEDTELLPLSLNNVNKFLELDESSESDDDMFGSSERTKNFRGWTVQQVKDHFDDLNSELYGYEAYWEDDDDPEFVRKENELKAMMQYARIRFGEDFYQYLSNWREYSDRQMARYDDRTKADPFNNTRYYGDPRITKAGKMHKQDQRVRAGNIKDRIGKHTPHELPENDESDDELFGAGGEKMYVVAAPDDEVLGTFQNPETAVAFAKKQIASYLEDGWGDLDTIKVYKQRLNSPDDGVTIAEFPITDDPLDESDDDDDELFGSAPSAATLTQSIARAIVRSDKSARLITSTFMVGFALGKTPGGEHLLQYWKSMGQEKQDAMLDGINDAVYDLIANKVTEDDDDDMFGSSTRPDSKVIAQELDLWLRRRQSSSRRPIIPSSAKYVQEVIAAFNKSFLKGIETWAEYPLYGNTDIKYDIREYFENSRGVNFMDYVDQVNESEESDDELFGDLAHRRIPPKGLRLLRQWAGADPERRDFKLVAEFGLRHNLNLAQTLNVLQWFDDAYHPEKYNVDDDTATALFHAYENVYGAWLSNDYPDDFDTASASWVGESNESDDDLFGVSGPAAQRMIYKLGKQMLAKLEQAYNDPHVKAQYEKLTQGEEPDVNRLFEMVCRLTRTPYSKAIVVDAIVREYAGGFSSLIDFGTLIDSGEWQQDMVETWDMFGKDPDVGEQEWFQKEIEYFKWENQ